MNCPRGSPLNVTTRPNSIRIYYHLYLGPSWKDAWSLHLPLIKQFAESALMEKLVICVYGSGVGRVELGTEDLRQVEIRKLATSIIKVNEFNTLREIQKDARDPAQNFSYCAYLHSKSSSSATPSPATREWSTYLATALVGSLSSFSSVVAQGFNAIGNNLALGVFEDFSYPRLHFSGNFWCATRVLIEAAREIALGTRYTAVRHNAEWWLDTAAEFAPFNVFSTGVDHYRALPDAVDWGRLERRLLCFRLELCAASRSMEPIKFLRLMASSSAGNPRVRRFISDILLRSVPHHRWPRLLNVLDILMRTLGSRKSVYFFCAESR